MLASWNWKKRSYWDNLPPIYFKSKSTDALLTSPLIKIPLDSELSKEILKQIKIPKEDSTRFTAITVEGDSNLEFIEDLGEELLVSAILKGVGAGLVTLGTWLAYPDAVAGPYDEIIGVGLIWIGRGFLWLA